MRELRYNVAQPSYRSQTITIATALVDDAERYSKEDIAQPSGTGGGEYAQKLLWLSSLTCVSWMVVSNGPIPDNASLSTAASEVLGDKTFAVSDLPG